MADIKGSTVVVTGGQRGLGRALVNELIQRGAAKVYATARTPQPQTDPRIVPVAVDVTNQASVDAIAEVASDANIVINNAGIAGARPLLTARIEDLVAIFDTNVFGPVRVAQAFAPILRSKAGSALVDIHSVMSWASGAGGYGASKAAIWSITNDLRLELRASGVQVTGVHVSFIDTDMAARVESPKLDAQTVARTVIAGIEAGDLEVLVDPASIYYKAHLSGPVEDLAFDAEFASQPTHVASRAG